MRKKIEKFLAFLLCLCLFITMSTGITPHVYAEGTTTTTNVTTGGSAQGTGTGISGIITLPNSEVAPAGGLGVEITAQDDKGTPYDGSDDLYTGTSVTIPEGSNSINYTIPAADGNYIVRYYIASNTDYVREGYYASGITKSSSDTASKIYVSGAVYQGINLDIIKGSIITGTISLPDGGTAQSSLPLRVEASGDNRKTIAVTCLEIPAGSSTAQYKIVIPSDVTISGYYLGCMFNSSETSGYIREEFYSNSSGVTFDKRQASLLNSGTNYGSIDFTLAKGKVISGSISLPNGAIAPAGGLNVYIGADDVTDPYSWYSMGYTSIFISEGQTSTAYSLVVPANNPGGGYRIRYNMSNIPGYVREGCYNNGTTVPYFNSPFLVDVSSGDASNINLTIMQGFVISGTVSRPAGESTSDNIQVDVYARSDNGTPEYGGDDYNTGCNVLIPAGSSQADYSLTVPNGSYYVNYSMYNNTAYIGEGYYSVNSLGEGYTAAEFSNAAPVVINNSAATNVNLTLLKGTFISGTIVLPNGAVAPAGGIRVRVEVDKRAGEYSWSSVSSYEIVIGENENSKEFAISVPGNAEYELGVYPETGKGYMTRSYYNSTGTVIVFDNAEAISVGSTNVSGLSVALVPGKTVSGVVSRPAGASTAGSLGVDICSYTTSTQGYQTMISAQYVQIPDGSMSTGYTITVPENTGIKLGYRLRSSVTGYLDEGYYSTSGTEYKIEQAPFINVGNTDIGDQNLTLLKGIAIGGTISLPDGAVAGQNLEVEIIARSDNGTPDDWSDDSNFYTYGTIASGSNSAGYSITVPSDMQGKGFKVSYYLMTDAGYIKQGYYSVNGTVAVSSGAGMAVLGDRDLTGINLQLLTGHKISGTVYRPEGASIDTNITLKLYAWDDNGTPDTGIDDIQFGNVITIPAGQGYANYELVVANGNYKLAYDIITDATDGYIRDGYYNSNGTLPYRSSAEVISISNSDVAGKDLKLIAGSILTGKISLPNGETAPAGGIDVEARVWSDGGTVQESDDFYNNTWVSIPEGMNSVPFSVTVPGNDTRDYRISGNPSSSSVYTGSTENTITLQNGSYTGSINIVLNKAQLKGQVVDPSGNPVSYGMVNIRISDGDGIPGVDTDENGCFTIGGLADGKYILQAYKWGSNYTSSKETTIDIVNGSYVPAPGSDSLVLNLTNPQVSGTVYYEEGKPAVNGNIEVRDTNGKWVANTNIRQDGTYLLGGLNAGTYVIQAYPDWQVTDYTPSVDQTIVIKDGEALVKDIMLTVPQIRGTVTYPDQTPVQEGWVEIYSKATGMGLPGAGIYNGSYSFGGLQDGEYVIKARPDTESIYCASDESVITIAGGKYSSGNINLILNKAQITGTICSPSGNPAEYGWVEIRQVNGDWIPGVPTDGNGNFAIGGLGDGTYILRAYPNGNSEYTSSEEVSITIENGVCKASSVKIFLGLPQITGKLVSPDGLPELCGYVEVRDQSGRWLQGIGVNYDGSFAIGGLPDGTYIIKGYPGSNSQYTSSEDIEVSIQSGEAPQDITVALNNPQFTGKVQNPDGTSAQYGSVEVYGMDGRWAAGSPVDNNGMFKIGSLPDGTYEIKAYPDGGSNYCESASQVIEIRNGMLYQGNTTLQLTTPLAVGFVKDPSGTSAEKYGYVEIRKASTGEWVQSCGVNESGSFSIGDLADGTYTLRAVPDSSSQYSISDEITIAVKYKKIYDDQNNNITDSLVIKLAPSKIFGRVTTPDGNNASFGWVEAKCEDGRWITGIGIDYNGEFKFGRLGPAGKYIIKAYPGEGVDYTESKDVIIEIDSEGNVVSASEGLQNGVLSVKLSGVQFKGKVVGSNNTKAGYGWVEVEKEIDNSTWEWVNGIGVNWDGEFKVGGLADGVYRLKAFPDCNDITRTSSGYYTITITNGSVSSCDVAGAYDTGLKVLTMTTTVPQVTGVIKGPKGESVSYGWVELRDADNNYVTGIGAGENGEFAIGSLEAGLTYKIKAYPAMGSEFTESSTVSLTIGSDGTYSGGPVTLSLSGTQVTGTVVDPNGQATNSAWIEVYTLDGQWVTSTGVDENGKYKIGGLADGQYEIRAFADPDMNYANSQLAEFKVSGNDLNAVTLNLQLEKPQITGTVYMPGGAAAKGGWVEIGDEQQSWILSVPIDKDGTFKLPALENGKYTIQAFPGKGSKLAASEVQQLNVDGSSQTISISLKQ